MVAARAEGIAQIGNEGEAARSVPKIALLNDNFFQLEG